jgi:hypothetical protein
MVLRGHYLERSVVVHRGGVALDALYHRGTRTRLRRVDDGA